MYQNPSPFAFHATGVRMFEVVDVSGMYLVSALGLTFALRRLWGWSDRQAIAWFIVVTTASIAAMIALGTNGILVFAAEMLPVFALELHLRERNPRGAGIWIVWTAVALLVGFVIWLLDFHGPLCEPDNHLVTGHAVWHVLTAIAIGCFYRFQEAADAGRR